MNIKHVCAYSILIGWVIFVVLCVVSAGILPMYLLGYGFQHPFAAGPSYMLSLVALKWALDTAGSHDGPTPENL